MFWLVVAIGEYVPPISVFLSTVNPASFEELSVHERLICEVEIVLAPRLVGGAGVSTTSTVEESDAASVP